MTIDEARDVAARMPPCRERTALGTALAEVDRLTSERNFYRGERDAHHAIQMERTADVARLTRERDDARSALSVRYALAREVEALLGIPEGPAGPEQLAAGVAAVRALVADRDRLAAALAEVREAAEGVRRWLDAEIDVDDESEDRAMVPFRAALAATPTDLATARDARVRAEALRRAAERLDRGREWEGWGWGVKWLRSEAERIGGGR